MTIRNPTSGRSSSQTTRAAKAVPSRMTIDPSTFERQVPLGSRLNASRRR